MKKPIGELEVITGPMMAGKTTEALSRLFKEASIGFECLYINHSKDTRSNSAYSTHNPLYKEKLSTLSNVELISVDRLINVDIIDVDVIAVDEFQFFSLDDVDIVLDWVKNYGKWVIISGLNLDFECNPFETIHKLTPLADNYTMLHSYCEECASQCPKVRSKAIFSHRKGDNVDKIAVGGKGMYVPLCRECYTRLNESVKPLLILDLNGVLIDREYNKDRNYCPPGATKCNNHLVWRRLGLYVFLAKAFREYKVAIWSSVSQYNIEVLVNHVIPPDDRDNLLFVWSQDKCEAVEHPESLVKPLYLKNLSEVWKKFPEYNQSNTMIIDDSILKMRNNPKECCQIVEKWTKNREDGIDMMEWLIPITDTPQPYSPPLEFTVTAADVALVCDAGKCTEEVAIRYLVKHRGDLINVMRELNHK